MIAVWYVSETENVWNVTGLPERFGRGLTSTGWPEYGDTSWA